MNVTILGTGNMARGIGTRLVAGGHTVTIVGREQSKTEQLVTELQAAQTGATVTAAAPTTPLADAAIVFAVPWDALVPLVQQYGTQLSGKTLIDISNPIDFSTMEPALPPGT